MVPVILLAAGAAFLCDQCGQRIEINLPAGTLYQQLSSLADSRNLQFLYNYPELETRRPRPALKGTFTVSGAIAAVLADSPFTFEWSADGRCFFVFRVRVCNVLDVSGLYPVPPCKSFVSR